jgi:hypothetical protein
MDATILVRRHLPNPLRLVFPGRKLGTPASPDR